MKKKIISIVTVVVLLFTTVTTYAANVDSGNLTINNGEYYEDEQGNICVTNEVSELDLIKELLKNDDQTLIEMGYSKEEIKLYKDFVSQSKSRGAKVTTGKITYTVKWYKDYFKYSNGKTYLRSNFSWSWSTKPVAVKTDIVAMGTNENFAVKNSSASAHVNYYLNGIKDTAHKTVISQNVYTKANGTCAYTKFVMLKTREPGPQLKYALGGSMTVDWVKNGNIKTVAIGGNYGHTTKKINPSVSVDISGLSISFSPQNAVSSGPEALVNAYR